jgi:adenylyltransferase/sulfurtransferase
MEGLGSELQFNNKIELMDFSKNETEKYQRQFLIPQFGEKGQKKLKKSKVIVIGAGGLGSPVLYYLAVAGLGSITFLDGDKVEISNLNRQILYTSEDVGKHKAKIAEKRLKKLNPDIKVEGIKEYLEEKNAEKCLKGFDLIVDCTDNFETRYLIDKYSKKLEIPFVHASVYHFTGQVSIFNANRNISYSDLYPETKDHTLPEDRAVLGPVCGVMGSYQAMEVIKYITGQEGTLDGKLLMVDLLHMKHRIVKIGVI